MMAALEVVGVFIGFALAVAVLFFAIAIPVAAVSRVGMWLMRCVWGKRA